MRNRVVLLLAALLLSAFLAGCGADTPAQQPGNDAAEENTQEPELVIDSGIIVNGTVVEAAGKQVDFNERNEYVKSIVSCRWLEKNKVAVQCRISGGKSQAYYFAVYDVVRDLYVYEQYGKQFIWQNDDLDTLVYVLDYSDEGEKSQVKNKKDMVLYESGADEQILNVTFVPKGLKIEVADLRGDNPRQVLVEAAS